MKTSPSIRTIAGCATALGLLALGALSTAQAQDLNARLELRPLTPQEITDYSLGDAQRASGLNTVGLGQPGYLEALVNIDYPASEVSVDWELTGKPPQSSAALEASPLGTNVPPYKIVDRAGGHTAAQVAARTMLRPDVEGQYTVTATITTTSNGVVNLTQTINAGTYLGASTCAFCHSGGIAATNLYTPWSQTLHAKAFEEALDGISTDHFQERCISCHVVGFDTNSLAVNGGWDDVKEQTGWMFPGEATNGNFAAMPQELQDVSNIQCENCHGPGSLHAYALGDTNLISVTMSAGDCSQCHDSLTHHFKSAEWNNSTHAAAVEETRASCSRCHTAKGFANFASGEPAVDVPYEVITCAACHSPHDPTNPHQIRTVADVTLMDDSHEGGNTVVTKGGKGKLCMQCHISRRDAVTYVNGSVSSHYGPHHGPQTDMLVGANAITYGKDIPSSAHYAAVEDSCVECHMQPLANGDEGFTEAGGHTFKMKATVGTNTVEMVKACQECHGEIESFDFARQDYDGDGVVEGVQTEVKGLMSKLAMLLPPVGQDSIDYTGVQTLEQKQAYYNYLFVMEDGSFGIHNLSYAVGVLKASIANLNDDANNDNLPDSWQTQYFTGINDPNAAPDATPAGDGIPNWLKYSLGLNPWTAGMVVPNGVVYASGKTLGGEADTVYIYTAAEVAFETEAGKTYQIQEVSELSGGWQNVGAPITGDGNSVSYVTPTRDNVQQFFRVVIQ